MKMQLLKSLLGRATYEVGVHHPHHCTHIKTSNVNLIVVTRKSQPQG